MLIELIQNIVSYELKEKHSKKQVEGVNLTGRCISSKIVKGNPLDEWHVDHISLRGQET